MKLIETTKDSIVILPGMKEKVNDIQKQIALNSEISKLSEHWKSVMAQTKTYNELMQTFSLKHIEKKNYGYCCRIYAPDGLPLENLETLKPAIESGLQCIFVCNIRDDKAYGEAKIIKPNQLMVNKIPFTPVKVKPYEFYAGNDISGEPIVFNLNDTPMVLLGGDTGSGKNGCLDHAITSWIHSCNDFDIELYLFQGAKNDLVKYGKCEQVKAFMMGNFEELLMTLEYISNEMKRRTLLMQPMVESMQGDNLYHYNLKYGHMPYIMMIIDEFLSVMPDSRDDKDTKDTKNCIVKHLEDIGRFGRALGVNYIISHQKPEKELCPTFLKNMSTVRICFGYTDDICPQIVLGQKYAKYAVCLPPRRAYFVSRNRCDYLFTTNLKDRIKQFIQPSFVTGHETIFDRREKEIPAGKPNQESQTDLPQTPAIGKVPNRNFEQVNMTANQILAENIRRIKEQQGGKWVEYEPVDPSKVIDRTGLPKVTYKPVRRDNGGK